MSVSRPLIAFKQGRCIARGELADIATVVRDESAGDAAAVLVLDARTSERVDIPLQSYPPREPTRRLPRAPGRPRLGVVSREVSLLPRHWEWLATQRGGASAELRRLVEEALRKVAGGTDRRRTMESVDRFMQTMAGDLPGYEEASRAFYQDRRDALLTAIATWPEAVRSHLQDLLEAHWTATAG